jgi:hypothetical protein
MRYPTLPPERTSYRPSPSAACPFLLPRLLARTSSFTPVLGVSNRRPEVTHKNGKHLMNQSIITLHIENPIIKLNRFDILSG